MADEKMARAQTVYKTLCDALDDNEWHYKKDPEKLRIDCSAQGEDLPIELSVVVDAGRQLIILLSRLPFVIPEDKRLDVAIAVSVVNDEMVDGSFDYDVTNGQMYFRLTSSFIESEISKELVFYMVICSCQTIDNYNDKFLMLGKGLIGIDKFIESETKN